ncbi:unnamed protein product [Pylaiella littoralis]
MLHLDGHGGRCASRGLCEDIKLLTEQRLVFEKKLILGMSTEGRVTYLKLKGDQLLHQAEMARHGGVVSILECEGLAAVALEAYLTAQKEASSNVHNPPDTIGTTVDISNTNSSSSGRNGSSSRSSGSGDSSSGALPELHPLRVELALRISSVLLHLLDRPVEAWEAGYPVYLAASERPARLGTRGLVVAQVLRDHLARIHIQGEGLPRQHEEGSRNSKEKYDKHHNKSVITTDHKQAITCGEAENRPAEGFIEGEWGFLRMSAGGDEDIEKPAGLSRTPSDRLRVLAQVKQARACMNIVTTTEGRVLLGTMEHAGIVQSALKKARK